MARDEIHAKATAMRYLASIVVLLACPLTTVAQVNGLNSNAQYPDVENDMPLSEAQLYSVFKGKTHKGTYNFLNKNISSFAFTETTEANGKILHIQQDKLDTGEWNISDEIICYDYDDPNLFQACFKIYARGNCYYHYQVSVEGRVRYGFTARSVIAGETPDCEPSLV